MQRLYPIVEAKREFLY